MGTWMLPLRASGQGQALPLQDDILEHSFLPGLYNESRNSSENGAVFRLYTMGRNCATMQKIARFWETTGSRVKDA